MFISFKYNETLHLLVINIYFSHADKRSVDDILKPTLNRNSRRLVDILKPTLNRYSKRLVDDILKPTLNRYSKDPMSGNKIRYHINKGLFTNFIFTILAEYKLRQFISCRNNKNAF